MKRTKSKDLSFYKHFYKYNDPEDIDTVKLAKKLNVSQQKVAGHIRSAKNNSTITQALIKEGDTPPLWFAGAEPLLRHSSTAQVPVNTAQTVETHASLPSIQAVSIPDRSAALSTRSAPPAYVYRLARAPPPNPLLEEAHKLLRETIEEDMRDSLNQMKRRRTSPRMPNLEELTAKAEAYRIWQKIEDEKTAQILFILNLMQTLGTSKPLDIEEVKEFFTKSYKELRPTADDTEWNETFEAIGNLLNGISNTGPSIDLLQRTNSENQKSRKSEGEALIDLAKLFPENPPKNWDLEKLKHQNRKIRENFLNNIFTI